MTQTKSKLILWICGLAIFGASCTAPQDIKVERETVDLAFPLFTSVTTLSDLIESGQDSSALMVFPDNSMGFIYETEASISIPLPTINDVEVDLPGPETILPNGETGGVTITHAKFEAGVISLSFENDNITEDITLAVTFPRILKNGISLKAALLLPYNGSLPTRVEWEADLADHNLNLTHGDFKIEYAAKLSNGMDATISKATMFMDDITFLYVDGDWSSKTVPISIDAQDIGFFNHYSDGNVTFTNPKIKVTTQNPIGIKSKINFNSISVLTNTNQTLTLESHTLNNGMNLSFPSMIQVGENKTTQLVINKANSNIVAITGAQPKEINYNLEYLLSPNGVSEGFLSKDSQVDINLQTQLPFEGKVEDFKVVKEFDVKFTNEYVQAAYLKLQAKNHIPLDARIQIYFKDNAGIILDSITSSNGILAIDAAEVEISGDVNQTTHWEEEIPISSEKWERIKPAVKVELVTSFTSSESGQVSVKIKSNQHVELNAGLKLVVLP